MKKLLVLALVLSVVGLANAGLVTTTLVENVLKAEVDTDAMTIAFIGLAPASPANDPLSVTVLGLSMVADAGSLNYISTNGLAEQSSGFELNGSDWMGYAASSTNGKVGILALFSFDGVTKITLINDADFGNSEVFTYAGGTNAISLEGMEISIPEPMTMILLGLGGLFLRRK